MVVWQRPLANTDAGGEFLLNAVLRGFVVEFGAKSFTQDFSCRVEDGEVGVALANEISGVPRHRDVDCEHRGQQEEHPRFQGFCSHWL